MQAAKRDFNKALKLDRQSTISRGWYVHFLFETGEREEALRLFALVADEQASNPQAHAAHGVYLFRAGRHDEAERALLQALALDRNCWPAHYGMTQLYLATRKQRKAEEHLKRLKTLVEPEEFEDLKRRLKPMGRER